jgi:hypothetical protein
MKWLAQVFAAPPDIYQKEESMIGFLALAFAAGYAASAFTWDKVKEKILGAEALAQSLAAKAKALRDKVGSL